MDLAQRPMSDTRARTDLLDMESGRLSIERAARIAIGLLVRLAGLMLLVAA